MEMHDFTCTLDDMHTLSCIKCVHIHACVHTYLHVMYYIGGMVWGGVPVRVCVALVLFIKLDYGKFTLKILPLTLMYFVFLEVSYIEKFTIGMFCFVFTLKLG